MKFCVTPGLFLRIVVAILIVVATPLYSIYDILNPNGSDLASNVGIRPIKYWQAYVIGWLAAMFSLPLLLPIMVDFFREYSVEISDDFLITPDFKLPIAEIAEVRHLRLTNRLEIETGVGQKQKISSGLGYENLAKIQAILTERIG